MPPDVMPEKEMMPELPPCGAPILKTAERTEYFLRAAGHLAQKHFRLTGAELLAKEAEKQVISEGSIIDHLQFTVSSLHVGDHLSFLRMTSLFFGGG